MKPEPPLEEDQVPPSHAAGAYGFSRNELRALVVFGLLAGGWTACQWFERRSSAQVPSWIIEDVQVGPSSAGDSTGQVRRVSASPTVRRAPRVERTDGRDPGHALVDLNTAGPRELTRLPGIGPELASRIIAEREKNGPYASLLDFQRVRGIGPKKAAMLAGWVSFSRTDIPASTDTSGHKP
jgi:competence ComEA-like helix-hairpin-helix protein